MNIPKKISIPQYWNDSEVTSPETYCPNCVDEETAKELDKLDAERQYCNKICFSEDNPDFFDNRER